jgi:hypothetical protein
MDLQEIQEILLRSFKEGICAKEVKLNNTKLQEEQSKSFGSNKKGYSTQGASIAKLDSCTSNRALLL